MINSHVMVDLDKPKGWVIVRDSPNGLVRISGLFTIEENAKAELQKRLTRVENLPKVSEEGWGDPQLLEITIEQKLL
ncbi:hypothetical protein [Clostridium sp.]|uniref:hypothetical protein n=1 Tax=Clostridium sp. TaxID=1506 RepID=UPI0025BFDFC8|nr:hypothetical protein [Clostridium sp.]